jgi:predicted nucleic acid-binding protein
VDILMFLLDANVFLEWMLGQDRADDVQALLERVDPSVLAISDFSLYSIGIIHARHGRLHEYRCFLNQDVVEKGIQVMTLPLANHGLLVEAVEKYQFDFDDAYHYALASLYGLRLVSFDHHFDRIEGGRLEPGRDVIL